MEDVETQDVTTEASTEAESSSYADALKDDGTPSQESPSIEPESTEQPENVQTEDPEIELEVGGENFKGKQAQISRALKILQTLGDDGISVLENAEKLAELKSSYDKGFTQKTQELSQLRKSFEDAFLNPTTNKPMEPEEQQILSKLYKDYFTDQRVKDFIDRFSEGKLDQLTQATQENKSSLPEVQALQKEISDLKAQLGGHFQSLKQKEERELQDYGKKMWDDWAERMAKPSDGKKPVQITEDIRAKMVPWIEAAAKANPKWDSNKILDEAYRHVMIDQVETSVTQKVLKNAKEVERSNPPKITSKVGKKPDTEKSYSELLEE